MLRNRASCLLLGLVVLLSLSIISCTGSGSSSPTYTLSGTLEKTGVSDGTDGYVKLVVHGGEGDAPALYWAKSSPFTSEVATYSITDIAEGSYTGYAFIDASAPYAAGDGTSMPDVGDWVTDGGGILPSILTRFSIFSMTPGSLWTPDESA